MSEAVRAAGVVLGAWPDTTEWVPFAVLEGVAEGLVLGPVSLRSALSVARRRGWVRTHREAESCFVRTPSGEVFGRLARDLGVGA